jgi:hypothetical protein
MKYLLVQPMRGNTANKPGNLRAVQALIRVAGEQGPREAALHRLSSELPGLFAFQLRLGLSAQRSGR